MRKDLPRQVRKVTNTKHFLHRRDPKWDGDEDNIPRRESMHHRKNGDWKDSWTNSKIFGRVLAKQVGRPWNKIYSELARLFPKNMSNTWHDLVSWYVETDVSEINGKLMVQNRYCGWTELGRWGRRTLYVCPKTGLLKQTSEVSRKYKHKKYEFITVSDYQQIHKIFGVWYLVVLSDLPVKNKWIWNRSVPIEQQTETHIGNEMCGYWYRCVPHADRIISAIETSFFMDGGGYRPYSWDYEAQLAYHYGRKGVYAAYKKQLSHKELKQYGLENDPLQMYTCSCGFRCFSDEMKKDGKKKCPTCRKEMKLERVK